MIENKSSINNSIAFNPVTDDLTYRGYMALAYTVCGVKTPSGRWKQIGLRKARQIFGLNGREAGNKDNSDIEEKRPKEKQRVKSRTNKSFKYMNIRLIDINNGEIFKIFNNVSEASDFLGITDNRVNVYISTGYIRDKKYKIEADLNPNYVKGAHARTSVRVINVKTGFNKECETVKEAKEITGLSGPAIYLNDRDKRVSRDGWKFEYIED